MSDNPFLDAWSQPPEPEPAPAPEPAPEPEQPTAEGNPFLDAWQAPVEEPAPEEDVGLAEELGSSFGRGAASAVRGGSALYGLATGNMDNAGARYADRMDEFYDNKSQALTRGEKERAEAVENAQPFLGSEQLGQAGAWLKETFGDPRLVANMFAEQGASFAIPGGAGAVGARLGSAAANKLTQLGAPTLAKVSQKAGTGAAIATGGAMQGGEVVNSTYQDLMKVPESEWLKSEQYASMLADNVDPQVAKDQIARDLAAKAGTASFAISLATQFIPGGAAFEKAVGRQTGSFDDKAISRFVTGFLGEGTQEALEEGGGALSSNLGVGAIDSSRKATEGLGESMAAGAAIGGPIGGITKTLAGPGQAEVEPPADAIDEELTRMRAEAAAADEADALAQAASQAVEEQGGDALDQVEAGIEAYNAVEQDRATNPLPREYINPAPGATQPLRGAEIDQQLQRDGQVPASALVDPSPLSAPDAAEAQPQPSVRSLPGTPAQEEVADARAFEGEDTATRLQNANRINALADKAEAEGNTEFAGRLRQQAMAIREDIRGLPVAEVTQETRQEFQPAEQVEATEAPREPETIEGRPIPGQLTNDGVIYAGEPDLDSERRAAKRDAEDRKRDTGADQLARTGVFEPGSAPRASAPLQEFGSSVATEEATATEAEPAAEPVETEISDADYGNPVEERAFTIGDPESRGTIDVIQKLESDPSGASERLGLEMDVVSMSPSEYIQRAAEERAREQGTTVEFEIKKRREAGAAKIDDIARQMESGTQFAAPSLDYSTGGFTQDGLHRAMAAEKLGFKRLPVSVVREAANMEVRTPAASLPTVSKEQQAAYKKLDGVQITEQVEDEDGNVYEVQRPASREVRQISKRLSVVDGLMGCLRS